jgi:hypothetical protein
LSAAHCLEGEKEINYVDWYDVEGVGKQVKRYKVGKVIKIDKEKDLVLISGEGMDYEIN